MACSAMLSGTICESGGVEVLSPGGGTMLFSRDGVGKDASNAFCHVWHFMLAPH